MLNLRTFIKMARPLQLMLAVLTYGVGAGISRYLGHPVHIAVFGLGLLGILAIQTAAFWLVEYFHFPLTPFGQG